MMKFPFKYGRLLKRVERQEFIVKSKLLEYEHLYGQLLRKETSLKNEEEACYHAMSLAQNERNYKTYELLELRLLEIKEDLEKFPLRELQLKTQKEKLSRELRALAVEKKKWESIKRRAYEAWMRKSLRAEDQLNESDGHLSNCS